MTAKFPTSKDKLNSTNRLFSTHIILKHNLVFRVIKEYHLLCLTKALGFGYIDLTISSQYKQN